MTKPSWMVPITGLVLIGLALVSLPSESLAGTVDSSTDVKVWGRAIMNVHYDTYAGRSGIDFANYVVDDEDADRLNFNPRDTRLGLKATSAEGDWKYACVFEIDFYGDNAGHNLLPRLRLGYGEMANSSGFSLRAGQDWIPIATQNPATIDFGILSWGGNLWWRVPQVVVRKKSNDIELMAGAMKHRIATDQDVQEKMPWIVGRLQYTGLMDGKGLVAVGGGFRSVEVDSIDYAPYVVAGELKLPLGDQVVLVAEAWMGAAVANEFVRYGFTYNRTAGEETEIKAIGGFASLTFNVDDKNSLNAGVGLDMPETDDIEYMVGDQTMYLNVPYRQNMVIFGNFKHMMSKHFGLGAEVMHFTTTMNDADETELTGQRITGSIWSTY